jgi:hypothetical protein
LVRLNIEYPKNIQKLMLNWSSFSPSKVGLHPFIPPFSDAKVLHFTGGGCHLLALWAWNPHWHDFIWWPKIPKVCIISSGMLDLFVFHLWRSPTPIPTPCVLRISWWSPRHEYLQVSTRPNLRNH